MFRKVLTPKSIKRLNRLKEVTRARLHVRRWDDQTPDVPVDEYERADRERLIHTRSAKKGQTPERHLTAREKQSARFAAIYEEPNDD